MRAPENDAQMETPKGQEVPRATEPNMPTHQDLDVKRPGLGGDGDDAPESEIDDSA